MKNLRGGATFWLLATCCTWLAPENFVAAGQGSGGDQRLIFAAGEGDIDKVRDLLSAGADVEARTDAGETALHVSAIRCNPAVVEALLEAGADPEAKTGEGDALAMPVLHWFANMATCSQATVARIIDAGANVLAVNSRGETALDMIKAMEDRKSVADLLRSRGGEGAGGKAEL